MANDFVRSSLSPDAEPFIPKKFNAANLNQTNVSATLPEDHFSSHINNNSAIPENYLLPASSCTVPYDYCPPYGIPPFYLPQNTFPRYKNTRHQNPLQRPPSSNEPNQQKTKFAGDNRMPSRGASASFFRVNTRRREEKEKENKVHPQSELLKNLNSQPRRRSRQSKLEPKTTDDQAAKQEEKKYADLDLNSTTDFPSLSEELSKYPANKKTESISLNSFPSYSSAVKTPKKLTGDSYQNCVLILQDKVDRYIQEPSEQTTRQQKVLNSYTADNRVGDTKSQKILNNYTNKNSKKAVSSQLDSSATFNPDGNSDKFKMTCKKTSGSEKKSEENIPNTCSQNFTSSDTYCAKIKSKRYEKPVADPEYGASAFNQNYLDCNINSQKIKSGLKSGKFSEDGNKKVITAERIWCNTSGKWKEMKVSVKQTLEESDRLHHPTFGRQFMSIGKARAALFLDVQPASKLSTKVKKGTNSALKRTLMKSNAKSQKISSAVDTHISAASADGSQIQKDPDTPNEKSSKKKKKKKKTASKKTKKIPDLLHDKVGVYTPDMHEFIVKQIHDENSFDKASSSVQSSGQLIRNPESSPDSLKESDRFTLNEEEYPELGTTASPAFSAIPAKQGLYSQALGVKKKEPAHPEKPPSFKKENKPKDKVSQHKNASKAVSVIPLKQVENKPKSKAPIFMPISDILTTKQKQVEKDVRTGAIPKQKQMDPMDRSHPHNILDSSAPFKKRGKEKNAPAKRKLTVMKKIILKEREERKQRLAVVQQACKIRQNRIQNSMSFPSQEQGAASSEVEKANSVESLFHSNKFREYCDHLLSTEINETAESLIQDLVYFQDRLHQKDPIKAKIRRRLVCGIREAKKYLQVQKLKCLIIAPDIERVKATGGLDDSLSLLIQRAKDNYIPVVFALRKKYLGKISKKHVPVSCIGIFSYEGREDKFHHLLELVKEAREAYQAVRMQIENPVQTTNNENESNSTEGAAPSEMPDVGAQSNSANDGWVSVYEDTDSEEAMDNTEKDKNAE